MRTFSRGIPALSLACLLASSSDAHAFSTRVHIVISNQVREALIAGNGKIQLRGSSYAVQLPQVDVDALTNYPLAFRAGAIGPDNMVFPAMTDPSHAVGVRPYEQCEALYNEALTGEERAYALGCFLHGTTDAIAHHYVNYMTGETFTLTPITSARQQSWSNVVRHIVAESMIQKSAAAQKAEFFSSGQLAHAIPKSFVLRTYLDDTSPVWKLMAHHSKEKFEAAEAKNPGASLPTLLAKSDLAAAEHLAMSPVYVKRIQASREQLRSDLKAKIAALQDKSTADGSELGVSAGPDGKLGTYDDKTACAASCPTLYATYFTYVGLLLPRKSASGEELAPAFDKISDKLGDDMGQFLPSYIDTVENLSSLLNQPLKAGQNGFGLEKSDLNAAFVPMTTWANNLTTLDYETVVQAVAPDWLIDLQDALQAVGVNIAISGIVKAIFQPVVQPIKDGIQAYVIDQAQAYLGELIDQLKKDEQTIEGEFGSRLALAAPPGLGGTTLDHFFDSGIFLHSFNIASATFGNHGIVLPEGEDPVGIGPASFDASHTPSWMQAGLCDYLDGAIFPLGHDVKGMLSVRSGDTTFAASVSDDSPAECHDGVLDAFDSSPDTQSCSLVELPALLNDPAHRGSLSRAYPPLFASQKPSCRNLVVPGLPDPPSPPVGGAGGSSAQGGSGPGTGGTNSSGGSGQGTAGEPGTAGACGPKQACSVGVSVDPCIKDEKNGCFLTCRCFDGVYACEESCDSGFAGVNGTGGAPGAGGASSSAPGATPGDPGSDGSCGCALPGRTAPSRSGLAALAVVGLAAARRRRRSLTAVGGLLAALVLGGCGDDGGSQGSPSTTQAGAGGSEQGGTGGSGQGGSSAGAGGAQPLCGQGRKCTPGVSIDPCFKDQKNGCFLICNCVNEAYDCEQKCETAGQGGISSTGGAGGNEVGGSDAAGSGGSEAAGAGGSDAGGSGGSGQAGSGTAGSGTAGSGQAGSGGGGDVGNCCEVNLSSTGCSAAEVQSCVCAQDSYCCDTQWDQTCVDEVTDFGCGSCGAGGSGGSSGGNVLNALGDSTWHGLQPRAKGTKTVTKGVQLEFSASSLQWVEIVNPYGPSRKREHRIFSLDGDGATLHTTVDAPAGWPIPSNNGQKRDFKVEVINGSPRQLVVTRDGQEEIYEEGAYPAPTDGLTATARAFETGPVSDAFCTSGLNGFDYKLFWDFARGKSAQPVLAEDTVAGAKLKTWSDPSGNNQFAVIDIDGFDKLGGTEMSDQYNFFVTYTGKVKHPGGPLKMKELNDVVEDGVWVFLGNKVGSTNSADLFLEVHGFAWADSTPDEPSLSLASGDVPIEIIVARCAKQISNVDVMISLGGGSYTVVGNAPTIPAIDDKLFPPGLFLTNLSEPLTGWGFA